MKKSILFLLLFPFALFAQNMSPKLLWDLGRVSLDAVSPDGKTAIYGVTRYNIEENKGKRTLFSIPVKGGAPTQITKLESSANGAQYFMGGKKIGFTHKGEFYMMNPDGTEMTAISDLKDAHDFKVFDLPDGKVMLLYSAPEKLLQSANDKYPNLKKADVKIINDLMYRHWSHWNDESFEHLNYQILDPENNFNVVETKDIMAGEKWDCPVPPFDGNEDYTFSPDGESIVYVAKKLYGKDFAQSTNTDLYQYDLKTGETKNLTEDMRGYDKNPKFSADGKYLAWTSMATDGYEADENRLWVMEVTSGKRMKINQVEYINDFKWLKNTLYYSFDFKATKMIGKTVIVKFDKNPELKHYSITKGDFNYGHFEIAGNLLVAQRQDMNHANEIFTITAKGKATAITHENDEIYNGIAKSKIEKRWIKTTDGKDMLTWIIYPPDFDATKKYPTLLYCQGGPQSAVSQFYSFRWNFQLMASQGYIVVAPNRRGLPGFGKKWNEDISRDWGGQAIQDYLSAIDEVAKEPFVDQDRLGAVGASYGGYSVYMLAGIHNKRFKAFISHCGLYNLESWYGSTEELFFANWDIGGAYWEIPKPKSYDLFSPHKFAQNWDTPILVIHAGKDFRVPENQGMEAFQAAQLSGIPSKFLYFPNESHWILSPQNGLIWHAEFFEWLDKWLKD